jgi:hypothetical protein
MSAAFDNAMADAVKARNYASKLEREAFKVGFRRGWYRREKDDPLLLSPREFPNAYNSGYWEGHGASPESLI